MGLKGHKEEETGGRLFCPHLLTCPRSTQTSVQFIHLVFNGIMWLVPNLFCIQLDNTVSYEFIIYRAIGTFFFPEASEKLLLTNL